ncbi:MAG: hypothetical protein ACOC5T_05330 [Elusimicrobiota bacterium]
MKNIIRLLIPISEQTKIPLMEITRKYVEYIQEEPIGEVPDILNFNKEAYEKTKQYYSGEDDAITKKL